MYEVAHYTERMESNPLKQLRREVYGHSTDPVTSAFFTNLCFHDVDVKNIDEIQEIDESWPDDCWPYAWKLVSQFLSAYDINQIHQKTGIPFESIYHLKNIESIRKQRKRNVRQIKNTLKQDLGGVAESISEKEEHYGRIFHGCLELDGGDYLLFLDVAKSGLDGALFSFDGDTPNRFNHLIGKLSVVGRITGKNETKIHISYAAGNGIRDRETTIKCPQWENIKENYTNKVEANLDKFVHQIDNPELGKLAILHGETGTGKTYFIRSLFRQLENEYEFFVVSDVNTFLDNPAYYYRMVSDYNQDRLFVLEDSAEALLEETRQIRGQRIGRVLNLGDGILTQGSNDLFIATFNEEITDIDDAVKRPGRTRAIVEFEKLSYEKSKKWLENKGCSVENLEQKKYTIAELYEIKNTKQDNRPMSTTLDQPEDMGF